MGTPLKTTVIPSRDPSAVTKLPLRWTQLTRLRWKARLKRLSAGSIATQLPKRKNAKKSRRNSKVSPCPSSKRWEVPLEACLAVCLIWEVCPVLLEVLLPLRTQLEDLLSKRLIKFHLKCFPSSSGFIRPIIFQLLER